MGFPHGSWLEHPFRADQRGTLAVSSTRADIIAQSIAAIVETRQGERVMLPDYGIPDFVFDVVDIGFEGRLAYFIEQQVKKYEPLVDRIRVRSGFLSNDQFRVGVSSDPHRTALSIQFVAKGSNTTTNLVWPTWKLNVN